MNTQQIRTDLFNIISTLDKDTECESVYFDLFARYATMALEAGAYDETLWNEVAHITDTYKVREPEDFELSDEVLSSCVKLMEGFEDDDPHLHGAVMDLVQRECDKKIGHHLHFGHYVLGNFYSFSGYYDNCFYQLMVRVEEHVKSQADLQADPSALPEDLLTGLGKMVDQLELEIKNKLESGDFETADIGLLDELKSIYEDDVEAMCPPEEEVDADEDCW